MIMGGRALLAKTGIESERMSVPVYNRVKADIQSILDSIGVKHLSISSVREKESHGDLDIVVIDTRKDKSNNEGHPGKIILDNIEKFGITDFMFINNNPFYSILYENKYQVDFIVSDEESALYTQSYLSNNDVGNMFGRMMKPFNITHGMDGLYYNHYIHDKTHQQKFLISKDPDTILKICGLDVEQYHKGFDTFNEMFEYVKGSKYFNPDLFKFENLNNKNRTRDKKRKVYNEFLASIDFNKDYPLEKYDVFLDYPWLVDAIGIYEKEWKRRQDLRQAVPAPLVIELTGLQGKELGNYLSQIRESRGESLIDLNQNDLKKVILDFFEREYTP